MLEQQQSFIMSFGITQLSSNVLIRLGDFHTMMELFCIIGKIITGSGFEEIVYQARLCTSSGIKSILSGKHYNRSWTVHESFAEALDRLFCKRFVESCSSELDSSLKEIKNEDDLKTVLNETSFTEYGVQYQEKSQCLRGHHGKNLEVLRELLRSYENTTQAAFFNQYE